MNRFIWIALLLMALPPTALVVGQSSENFDLTWSTIDGGAGQSAGGAFTLAATAGQPDSGSMAGGLFTLTGGFWHVAAITQAIDLEGGWNMVSSYVSPNPAAMATIFAPAGANLVLCKNDEGQVFWPGVGVDQIGDWDPAAGYQCYTTAGFALALNGTRISAGSPVDLPAGWSTIAYWRDAPLAVDAALAECSTQLLLAKNFAGEVYWPAYGVNQIGDMVPGQGYKVFMNAPCTLSYPAS